MKPKIINRYFHIPCILCLIVIFLQHIDLSAQIISKPFPQHSIYTKGTIKPNQESQTELDSETARFYRLWKTHYLARNPKIQEAYVYCDADGHWHGGNKAPHSLSVSEGHGYGMIIMAIMAGYDREAHAIFDDMFHYFKNHPSKINHRLMAWNQTVDTTTNDHNSDDATDGDLDIAYALLLADKQWGSDHEINYFSEACLVINALKQTNVNQEDHLILMGDFTEKGERFYNNCRSSDFIPDHFKLFGLATKDQAWVSVADKSYAILHYMQVHFSPTAGIFPDFIKKCNINPRPANPFMMENTRDGIFSYNACRIPWRLGCDFLTNGDARAKNILTPINSWIIKKTKYDPYQIKDGYYLNGQPFPGASGDNIAFIAPLGVSAMIDAKNQVWLNRIWDYATKEPLSDEEYYGNTIKLLCMIVMSGNWWE